MAAEVRRRTAPTEHVPLVLGHRGARVPGITENTIAAMKYATDKVDVLEFDLQLTADDQFVLMHDDTLDRTTRCTGPVGARTLADLRANCPTDHDDAPIPTFAEAVEYAASVGKDIAPEVKDVANVIPDAVLASFVAVLRRSQLVADTFVQSFHPNVFPRLRALERNLRFVHLAGSSIDPGVVRASGADFAGLSLPGLTEATVSRFHAVELPVWAWTAVNLTQLQLQRANGVDGVYTDIPRRAWDLYH
jgi:glycerophosphoryl diester phosphodiesterase